MSNHQLALSDDTKGASLYKKMRYEVSLGYTQLTTTHWWSKIEPYRLYLGVLPLKNKGNLEEILSLGVTSVLSVVENFELEDGWFNKTVKPADWREKGVFVHQIPAHLLYNYFTDNTAKVSTHAIKRFGAEFAKPIERKDYE